MTREVSIDYEAMVQDAMRGIVRAALRRVAELGCLPGEHHFYIAFETRARGVVLSDRLRARYPEEMTIVLQHQFYDLAVYDDRFKVTLSFDGVPERLTVPLRAVRVFFDPSVPYGIQFESSDLADRPADTADAPAAEGLPLRGMREVSAEPGRPAKVRPARKSRAAQGEAAEPAGAALSRSPAGRPILVQPKPDEPANDSKVVQLDKFRKR